MTIQDEQIKALEVAKNWIKSDKETFEHCGRKDTKGHFRSMMLIDELIERLKYERDNPNEII